MKIVFMTHGLQNATFIYRSIHHVNFGVMFPSVKNVDTLDLSSYSCTLQEIYKYLIGKTYYLSTYNNFHIMNFLTV